MTPASWRRQLSKVWPHDISPSSVDTESGSGALFLMEREKMHPFGRAVKSLPMRRRGLLFALISRAFGK